MPLRLIVDSPSDSNQPDCAILPTLAPLFADLVPLSGLNQTGLAALLRDLSFAVAELMQSKRSRAVVPTEANSPTSGPRVAVWEVGLERDGQSLLVSLFRQGINPVVAQSERVLSTNAARRCLIDAIHRFGANDRGLAMANKALLAAPDSHAGSRHRTPRLAIEISSAASSRIGITANVHLRRPAHAALSEVSRADLHALLFRGELSLRIEQSHRNLEDVHVFLFAEQLLAFASEALEASAASRGLLRRVMVGNSSCGVQMDSEGRTTLLLCTGRPQESSGWRLPPVPVTDFAKAMVSFGRRLIKQILAADRSQKSNLRLSTYRMGVRELSERLRSRSEATPKLNQAPESYRAFAESDSVPPPAVQVRPANRLRFSESWRADVPSIDLRSIFLAGDRIVVGSARELACIESSSGHLLWTQHTPRAVSVMTPSGVARISANGRVGLYDISDGALSYEVQLGPCMGASTSGAVVNAPGLPHMLLVSEGARHLVALDLDSSEIRWRRAVRPRSRSNDGPLKLRRAGKLMLVVGSDGSLIALDLLTGEVVWRHCGNMPYRGVVISRGDLFALSSESAEEAGPAVLEHIDVWSGALRWRATLPRPVLPLGQPLTSDETVLVPTLDGEATGVVAIDRATGNPRFDLPGKLSSNAAGCLVVDDMLVASSDGGELVAINLEDGSMRYRHVFSGWAGRLPGDRPTIARPVLRSGALFLPQGEVYVVRPGDGALLARLPCDLVPDAIRVDERCGIYVAEASGYLAAYHTLPSLTLVRPV